MPENPALRRLACLPSYQRLSQTQRTALRLHVGKEIPGVEAMALAGDPNPTRSWKSSRVQKCLADFRGAEPDVDELVLQFEKADNEAARAARAAAPEPEIVALKPPPIALEPPPPAPEPVATPAPPEPAQPVLQREPSQTVVLGGTESGISLSGLFPVLTEYNRREWASQYEAEQQERKRLIALIERQENNR